MRTFAIIVAGLLAGADTCPQENTAQHYAQSLNSRANCWYVVKSDAKNPEDLAICSVPIDESHSSTGDWLCLSYGWDDSACYPLEQAIKVNLNK